MSVKHRIHDLLAPAKPGDTLSQAFDIVLVTLIGLNVAALVLETVDSVYVGALEFFRWFEIVSVAIFSVEYILRIWVCVVDPRFASPVGGRVRFARSPLALIDLAAVLPFYLPMVGVDARFLRAIRCFRVFRILKLVRYWGTLQLFARVFASRKEQLALTICILCLLLLVASSLMYHAEHHVQPQAFSSIPAAMWWAVATVSTVGYGDVYPITGWGKVLASLIAILGVGLFALPTGILGAAFVEELQSKPKATRCRHCGKEL